MPLSVNDSFLKLVKKDLSANDGKVVFYKGEYCAGYSKCYGVFFFNSKDQPIIKVAKGKKTKEDWVSILIHEYCHFLQWYGNCAVWKDFDKDSFSFDDVISDPVLNKSKIITLMKLELDCEQRAIRIIKKNNLNIDIQNYSKKANAVLYKYAYLYKYHKWPNNNCKLKCVSEITPARLFKSYRGYLDIPANIIDIYNN